MRFKKFSYSPRIVIDLDNTIVAYDDLFLAAAREQDLVPSAFSGARQAVRDAVRRRHNGERDWRDLQAQVYGEQISRAPVFPGALEFVARVRESGGHVAIVSHKTSYAEARPRGPNLREAARSWLHAIGMISNSTVAERDVYFESSRTEKVNRIRVLRADIAIDDLVEVLTNEAFPAWTRPWLFDPGGARHEVDRIECFPHWAAMQAAFDVSLMACTAEGTIVEADDYRS